MKVIASLIILISNILLCVHSADILISATINSVEQGLFRKEDKIQITCDLTQVNGTNANITQNDNVFVEHDLENNKTLINVYENITDVKFDKEVLSVTIKKAIEAVGGLYKCIVREKNDVQPIQSNNSVNIKFWAGDIKDTSISINKGEKDKKIAEFQKGDNFTIDCSVGNVTEGVLHEVQLIHNHAPFVDFTLNGTHYDTVNKDNTTVNYQTKIEENKSFEVNIHDAGDKNQGAYKCEYLVRDNSSMAYRIATDEENIKYKNYGLKIDLSATLIIMSFVTLLHQV